MQSCKLMLKSITRLLEASEFTSPDGTNAIKLQSLLTLVVENLHATMKMKHSAPSLLDYCWDFEKAMRESIKRITNWSIKYFTHQKSYYPIPQHAMDLSAIAKLNPIPVVPMDKTDLANRREWRVNMGSVLDNFLLGSKQQNFQLAHCPCQPMGYEPTTRSSQQQCARRSH